MSDRAALAVLAVLFRLPSVSPDAVALPILLTALPLLRPETPGLPSHYRVRAAFNSKIWVLEGLLEYEKQRAVRHPYKGAVRT